MVKTEDGKEFKATKEDLLIKKDDLDNLTKEQKSKKILVPSNRIKSREH